MQASATSIGGLNGEEWVALLRVRTGPECPEGNRRELMWDSNLNCGTGREREKINQPELTASLRRTKGLSNSREELAGRGLAHAPPEAGGRGQGKGGNLAPEMAPPTKLPTGLQFLTKDFLRFWMVNIHQEGRS